MAGTIEVDLRTDTEDIAVDLRTDTEDLAVDLRATVQTHAVELRTATEDLAVDLKTGTEDIVVLADVGLGGGGSGGWHGAGDLDPNTGQPYGSGQMNVLIINFDDVGIDFFGGVSQYATWLQTIAGIPTSGGPDWPLMTNIQLIANEGVTFLNAYATPRCSPGRACWQTGRYSFRHGTGELVNDERGSAAGQQFPFESGYQEFAVNPYSGDVSEYILPRLLKPAGYTSCTVGKWHLAVPNGTPNTVTPFVASRWWEDDPRTGMPRGRIPWEKNTVANGNNAAYDQGYTGHGWKHPLVIGWDHFRGTHSNLERNPNEDLNIPFGPGTDAGPSDTSGLVKAGYYNYLWYDSMDGEVTQESEYITQYARKELFDFINSTPDPWFAAWELHAVHTPFGGTPDNGGGFSGMIAPSAQINSDPDPYTPLPSGVAGIVWDSARSAMESADYQIGQLRAKMGEDNWANTLVIIRCDNGSDRTVLNYATEEGENFGTYEADVIDKNRLKGSVYEGGVRVPLIVCGPLVQITDLFQTILDGAGVSRVPAELDNPDRYWDTHSFLPVLASDDGTTTRTMVYVEEFSKNGWSGNNSGDAANQFRNRAFSMEVHYNDTDLLPDSLRGLWKLISFSDEPLTLEMYRLFDKDGAPVDPYEQADRFDEATAGGVGSDLWEIFFGLFSHFPNADVLEPSFPGDSGANT